MAVDVNSPVWQTVKAAAETRIKTATESALLPGTSHDATNVLRGEVKALVAILRLADPDPEPIG